MTNREIAAKLFVSERTAEYHVEQIRNKLGFHSRRDIRAWLETSTAAVDATSNNLPTQLTSFLGREAELREGRTLLGTSRLLTLTGAGGTGKTRLALHLAADAVAGFRDGAWLVELAPISDPSVVATAVAATLRISERIGEATTDALVAGLRGRSLLLVLDNCEHVILACAKLADALLRSCPELTILATSREGLNVPGEAHMAVPPLGIPEGDSLPELDKLGQYDAVRLFVDRSAAHQPGFVLTADNAANVVRICRRLDGIPLAIELAAARVRGLSVAQVADRLDDRFRLLTGGGRTLAARQQTLRALIDWSYDLLPEPERILIRRLSVFVGGWSLEAAESICAGEGLERGGIFDHLAHLIDKSLVLAEERVGVTRYRMLETLHDYTREKLLDAGEAPAISQRHADHFFDYGAESTQHPAQSWVEYTRLGLEYDNCRAALEWIEAAQDAGERHLLLAASMANASGARGRVSELRRILEATLARSDPAARSLGRARALMAAAGLAFRQGDYYTMERLGPEILDLIRSLGLKRELGMVLSVTARFARDDQLRSATYREAHALLEEIGDARALASLEWVVADGLLERGDYAAARTGHLRCLEMYRTMGDEMLVTAPMLSLARIACVDGEYGRARALVEDSLVIRRRQTTDDRLGLAIALISLGEVSRCDGDAAAGTLMFAEALGYGREMADDSISSWAVHNLGHVSLASGDLRAAAMRFRDGLAMRRPAAGGPDIARGYAGLASVAVRAGDGVAAARLFGATEAILGEAGVVLVPCDELVRRDDLALARASLHADAFSSAFAEGESMHPDRLDAMTVALIAELDDSGMRGVTRA